MEEELEYLKIKEIQIKGGNMDLISIRRKYKNIRNIIIVLLVIALSILITLIVRETKRKIEYEESYIEYSQQFDNAVLKQHELLEQKKIEEEKRKKKDYQI